MIEIEALWTDRKYRDIFSDLAIRMSIAHSFPPFVPDILIKVMIVMSKFDVPMFV